MVKDVIPNATVLEGHGNWWWAGSLQQGLNWLKKKKISGDTLILFINDDVVFAPDYLQRARRYMAGKQGTMVLSRTRSRESGEILETGIVADMRNFRFKIAASSGKINCLSTRALFVYWADIQKIGDFHTLVLPHYGSDYEYTYRGYRKGLACETSSELVIETNELTSGYREHNEAGLGDFLKNYFSKKSPHNPVYLSALLILTASPLWIVVNLARIWGNAGFAVFRKMFSSHYSNSG